MLTDQTIGIIGIGRMGLGIATNVQKAGYRICYLDHPGNQPTQALRNAGAQSFSTAHALTEASDVIILCVTGSPEVEAVVFGTRDGEGGLLTALRTGKTVIDCSTAIPASTVKIAAKVQETGADFLDAPMTRTPKEAMEGRLNLIVGGDATCLATMRPLLDSFAENIVHAGPVGSGHRLKLLHNYVSLGFAAIVAECAAAAHKAQVDPKILIDVLAQGGGKSVVLDRLAPFIADGEDYGFRFSAANAAKDLGYYLTMTEGLGAVDDIATQVRDTYQSALKDGDDGLLVPHIIDLMKR